MRWTIALSGNADDRALRDAARWLRERASFELSAVHVQGEDAAALPSVDDDTELTFLRGESASTALVEHAARTGDAIIVGTRCGRSAAGMTRLGSVPRRILRRGSTPVLLVPTGPHRAELGVGPILAAVRPTPDGIAAAAMAKRLSESMRLPTLVAHVDDGGRAHRNTEALPRALRDAGLASVVHTLAGSVPEALLEFAASCDPCLIVCGSRATGGAPATHSANFGMLVGAVSPVPVLVVPQ